MKHTKAKVFSFRWRVALAVLTVATCLGGTTGQVSAENAGVEKPAVPQTLVAYVPQGRVDGNLAVAGSNTMQPLLSRLAFEFTRRHPEVRIAVEGKGTSTALTEFLGGSGAAKKKTSGWSQEKSGQIRVLASSRELTDTEIKQFASVYGYEPVAVPVAMDAVAIYVHKDNPLAGLTLEQVDAIFSTTRARGLKTDIRRWGQLGLADGWEENPIRLYGRDQKSGTRAFFKEQVLGDGEFVPTVQELPGAASVILSLSHDPAGIAYSGIGLQTSNVRVVPLAEQEGLPFVLPSLDNVMNESYPLRRVLYLYIDKRPGEPLAPVLQAFLTFVNSQEGQEAVVKAGFYPLPPKEVERNLIAIKVNEGKGRESGRN